MKKGFGIGLAMALSLLLVGCGNGAGAKKSDTVRLFVSGDTSEGNAYSKMAKKYEKETGIKVEVTDVPYADLTTKVTKAVQSNDAPDVARVSGVQPDWADYLVDLTSVAKSAGTLDSMTIRDKNDKVKALPTDVTAVGMFINADLFKKAGVSYPTSEKDIWTWDEFIEKANQVKAKTNAKYSMVMDGSDHRLRAFTYQYGGKDFFLNSKKTSYKTDQATITALKKFVELNNEGFMPKSVWTSNEDAASLFKSGQIPAYYSGSWQIADFSKNIDFDWKAVYMPYEKTRATNMGGNFLVAFKNSANSTGGKKFVKWLYKKENYKQLCQYAGYIPAVKNLDIKYKNGQAAYDVYNQEIAAAAEPISGKQTTDQVTMTMKGYKGLTGAYRDSMVKVLNKEISLDDAIKDTIKDYNDGYAKK
ncbi:ABC transporter substrate-binding protein [Lapidilactobacillus luobeiensis]|uniref:ABC transporter substrate-binding protein n=1 Tax=Lapidilactobacillus luobeiensis TaxID=2950371 RepID=UPI0021C39A69|nr:sugar ABC transporter substrate-binding protein [Lapidilactobacillus luobeiensis]